MVPMTPRTRIVVTTKYRNPDDKLSTMAIASVAMQKARSMADT
jgi:hypothetical protein